MNILLARVIAAVAARFTPSVSTIVAEFTATVDKLGALAAKHAALADAKLMKANDLHEEVAGHDAVADHALNVASKIKAVFL